MYVCNLNIYTSEIITAVNFCSFVIIRPKPKHSTVQTDDYMCYRRLFANM